MTNHRAPGHNPAIILEETSAEELKGRRFRLPDGAIITVWDADDLDVRHIERVVRFRRDKRDLADSGDGRCLLTILEQFEEVREGE